MTTQRPAQILAALLPFGFFALGAVHAITVWLGMAYLIPSEFLMLAGGLVGAMGIFILGLVVWIFWGLLGLLAGLLVEGSVRA